MGVKAEVLQGFMQSVMGMGVPKASRVLNEITSDYVSASKPRMPAPRPQRRGPVGNKALRDFEKRKAKEAQQVQLPELTRQEAGELEARRARTEYTEAGITPDHRRQNKDLKQRDLSQPKRTMPLAKRQGQVMNKEQFEQSGLPETDYPQAHHGLGLDLFDPIFDGATPRDRKYIQQGVNEMVGLKFGDVDPNTFWLTLDQHIGTGGIHNFLRKAGIKSPKIPKNATADQRLKAAMNMIGELIDSGYFDELVSRTYMPKTGNIQNNAKGQMTSQGNITGMTSIIP